MTEPHERGKNLPTNFSLPRLAANSLAFRTGFILLSNKWRTKVSPSSNSNVAPPFSLALRLKLGQYQVGV